MVETTADILAVAEVVGTDVDNKRIATGLRADMISSAIAPVFNSFPATAFAQNVGLVALTGIRSRFAVALGGGVLAILGLSPVLAAVVSLLPLPVLAGAGIVLFGSVTASGIRTLGKVQLRRHQQHGHRGDGHRLRGDPDRLAGVLGQLPRLVADDLRLRDQRCRDRGVPAQPVLQRAAPGRARGADSITAAAPAVEVREPTRSRCSSGAGSSPRRRSGRPADAGSTPSRPGGCSSERSSCPPRSPSTTAGSPRSSPSSTSRRPGAAGPRLGVRRAGGRGHPRAHQRARPHRVGGLRLGHRGRGPRWGDHALSTCR